MYFNDILHNINDTNDKILQEISIFCMTNSFKCHALSVQDIINDINNIMNDINNMEQLICYDCFW